MAKSENTFEALPQHLQQKLNSFKDYLQIFNAVERKFNGVYFEVLVEPQEPERGEIKTITIKTEETEDDESNAEKENTKEDNQPLPCGMALFMERFEQFKRTKNNYKFLLKIATQTKHQLRQEYAGKNYKVTLHSRRKKTNISKTTVDSTKM